MNLPGGVVNTITYDGDGRRRSYHDSAGLRRFLWDGENVLAETDSGGSTLARYTLAPELYGALVSQRRSGATSFHHGVHPERSRRDALGSTRQLSDGSQAVTDNRDYRAFGVTNASSGSNPNRFWWNGKWGYYWQPDPGNYWLRARVYEDDNAHFLSRDPAQDEINLYRYVANRPLVLVDPSGRQGCRWVWGKPPHWVCGCPEQRGWSCIVELPPGRMGYLSSATTCDCPTKCEVRFEQHSRIGARVLHAWEKSGTCKASPHGPDGGRGCGGCGDAVVIRRERFGEYELRKPYTPAAPAEPVVRRYKRPSPILPPRGYPEMRARPFLGPHGPTPGCTWYLTQGTGAGYAAGWGEQVSMYVKCVCAAECRTPGGLVADAYSWWFFYAVDDEKELIDAPKNCRSQCMEQLKGMAYPVHE